MTKQTCPLLTLLLGVAAAACAPQVDGKADPSVPEGVAALGGGTHSLDAVQIVEIGTRDDGLRGPRDLDFNPAVPGELWVVNRDDDSVVTYSGVGTDEQQALRRKDPYAFHFMEEVSSLSFSTDMTFATCGESRNTYDGQAAPNDFMGPTLWSADPTIFAKSNPDAVAAVGFDLGSHLDMLHESPLCMGIAWVRDNVYFAFEGLTGTIARYDFAADHGVGFDDHTNGHIERFVDVDVARVEDVPSHMVVDHDSGMLYVADTGNARIGMLDAATASLADQIPGFETPVSEMDGATWEVLVNADAGELAAPSGIALHNGVLYVADNATSRISAFTLDGERLDYLDLDLPAGALMGLRLDDDGRIYAIDNLADRVIRLAPAGD